MSYYMVGRLASFVAKVSGDVVDWRLTFYLIYVHSDGVYFWHISLTSHELDYSCPIHSRHIKWPSTK